MGKNVQKKSARGALTGRAYLGPKKTDVSQKVRE